MSNGRRIFLAHGSEDKDQIRELHAALRTRGHDPWLDEVDLIPGTSWREEIPKAIRSASIFLACLSTRSVGKIGYVQNEFRLALAAMAERPAGSIYLIPVRLDDCQIPDLQLPAQGPSLSDLHWVDLWREDGLAKLLNAIDHALRIPNRPNGTEPDDPPPPPRRFGRRLAVLLAVVVVMGIALQLVRDAPSPPTWPEPTVPTGPASVEAELGLTPGNWRYVQRGLRAADFDPLGVDGVPGANTRSAIRDWQSTEGHSPTGYLDQAQFEALANLGKRTGPAPPVARGPEPPPPDPPDPSEMAARTGNCILTIVHPLATLHAEPRNFSEELSAIPPGDHVAGTYERTAYGPQTEIWFKISVDGRTGWVKGDSWSVERRTGLGCP